MDRRAHRAFTLIELMIVLAIVGVLAGLLLTAVSRSLAASRNLACTNNLHQLGLALQSYVTTHDTLPPGVGARTRSVFVTLLADLGEAPLYHSINFQVGWNGNAKNATARQSGMNLLVCPAAPSRPIIDTNYAASVGTKDARGLIGDGVFPRSPRRPGDVVRVAAIADGLSTTVAMSEWITSTKGQVPPNGEVFVRSGDFAMTDVPTFATACSRGAGVVPGDSHHQKIGVYWGQGQWMATLYDHLLPPNSRACINGLDSTVVIGAMPASSRHGDWANALFVDGHVRPARSGIAVEVWRALGTRAGGEVIAEEL